MIEYLFALIGLEDLDDGLKYLILLSLFIAWIYYCNKDDDEIDWNKKDKADW